MSTINLRLCFPNEEALQARRQRRTAGERREVPGGVVTSERRPSAWPVFTADEDGVMRRQLLEQDTVGDWLGIAAAEATTPPSSPLPREPYHTTPGAEGTAEHTPRLEIGGGFAPLVPADDWRALAAPAWQGPPPRKAVETGWYPYVVPWSAYLFLGARRRLPDEIEEVLPSRAAPVSLRPQDTGPLAAAATATAPREKRGPAPLSRRRPPPPPPLSMGQVPAMRPPPTPVYVVRDPPSPVYVVREAPPAPPPGRRRMAGRPAPGPPPREGYEARATPHYRPVGHHAVPASPPFMAPPGYGPSPPTWYAETSGEWRDPRMPTSSARGWTGPPRFRGERRGRVYYRE